MRAGGAKLREAQISRRFRLQEAFRAAYKRRAASSVAYGEDLRCYLSGSLLLKSTAGAQMAAEA